MSSEDSSDALPNDAIESHRYIQADFTGNLSSPVDEYFSSFEAIPRAGVILPQNLYQYISSIPRTQLEEIVGPLRAHLVSADSVFIVEHPQYGIPLTLTAAELQELLNLQTTTETAQSETEFENDTQSQYSTSSLRPQAKRARMFVILAAIAIATSLVIAILMIWYFGVFGGNPNPSQSTTKNPNRLTTQPHTRREILLLIGGGPLPPSAFNSTELYDPQNPANNTISHELNIGRMGHVAGYFNSLVVVAGGHNSHHKVLNSTEIFEAGEWRFGPEMTTGRVFAISAVLNERFCICTGVTEDKHYEHSCECLDASLVWHQMAPLNVARKGAAAAVFDTKLYVVGGYNSNDAALSSCELYDPALDAWKFVTEAPFRKAYLAGAVLDTHLVFCGGYDWAVSHYYMPTCNAYDPSTDQWTELANMTLGRGDFVLTSVDKSLYALGGYQFLVGSMADVERLRSIDGVWETRKQLIMYRSRHAAVVKSG